MNIHELANRLEQEGYAKWSYSLSGEGGHDTHCLENRGDKWVVFYTEKGNEYDHREFHSEQEACLYLYDRVASNAPRDGI